MKTINTILPIYDSLEKQDRNRTGSQMPILTPRYRLPAFQWKDESDGAATVSKIELIKENGFLEYPSIGLTGWYNDGYSWKDMIFNGLDIISATMYQGLGAIYSIPNPIQVVTGDVIHFRCNFNITSGGVAKIEFTDPGGDAYFDLKVGLNEFAYTVNTSGDFTIYIHGAYGTLPTTLSLTNVNIWKIEYTSYFPTLPSSHAVGSDAYFQYKGDTLKYLLPRGSFYLKITMDNGCIYYSDYFTVTDIFDNLITDPHITLSTYYTFSHQGTEITPYALSTSGGGACYSNEFKVKKGEVIKAILFLTSISGQLPYISMLSDPGSGYAYVSNKVQLTAGLNEISLTVITSSETAVFGIENTTSAKFKTSEIILIRSYSPEFIKIAFNDTHDLGDILYHDGFIQTCFLEARLNNPTHDIVEVGEEKNGIFIAEKLTTKYKYKIIANVSRALYTILMRLPQHDTITITDEVGNVYTPKVGNIWVSAPNWIFYDICRIEIQFNDNSEFVWTSENNNLT